MRTGAAGCSSDAVLVTPTVYYTVFFADDKSTHELRREHFEMIDDDEAGQPAFGPRVPGVGDRVKAEYVVQGEVRPFLGTIVSVRTGAAGCSSDAVLVTPTVYYTVFFADDKSTHELRREHFEMIDDDEAGQQELGEVEDEDEDEDKDDDEAEVEDEAEAEVQVDDEGEDENDGSSNVRDLGKVTESRCQLIYWCKENDTPTMISKEHNVPIDLLLYDNRTLGRGLHASSRLKQGTGIVIGWAPGFHTDSDVSSEDEDDFV
eukprot:g1989.t1